VCSARLRRDYSRGSGSPRRHAALRRRSRLGYLVLQRVGRPRGRFPDLPTGASRCGSHGRAGSGRASSAAGTAHRDEDAEDPGDVGAAEGLTNGPTKKPDFTKAARSRWIPGRPSRTVADHRADDDEGRAQPDPTPVLANAVSSCHRHEHAVEVQRVDGMFPATMTRGKPRRRSRCPAMKSTV